MRPQAGRVRVRDYTCDCQSSWYELCQSGGVRFIRRTSRRGGRMVVEECQRESVARIDALWAKLLTGAAR